MPDFPCDSEFLLRSNERIWIEYMGMTESVCWRAEIDTAL